MKCYAARRSETTGRCRRPPTKGSRLPLELPGLVEIGLREYAGRARIFMNPQYLLFVDLLGARAGKEPG